MNKGVRNFIFFSSVMGMFLLSPRVTFADKIDDLKQTIADKKVSHKELEKKAQTLNSEMTSLRENLINTSRTLQKSEENLSETDRKLKDLQQKKEGYLSSLSRDQRAMIGLITAARKYSETPTSGKLAQGRPIDSARLKTIMKSMMPDIQKQSAQLQSQLAELEVFKENIAGQLEIQTEQNNKLINEQRNLAKLLEERSALYKSTENRRREQERDVVKLTKESKDLEELMQKLKSIPEEKITRLAPTPLPVNIPLPVQGSLQTGFGDKDSLGAESKGVTILARSDAQIVTPLAGTVKFAGPFQNYKQILIVEHRGGYHSLISGLGHIDTVVGASLAAGEPVGIAETSETPLVYYELRQDGKPVNPKKLLIAQKK